MKFSKLISFVALLVLNSCLKGNKENDSSYTLKPTTEIEEPVFKVSKVGDTLDVFNNVYVFYNANMNNTSGRNLTKDGYNIGLKWQCVEFVKRYYYKHLNHKMPNSYGHAKDFYNSNVKDGKLNRDRGLLQYTNGSKTLPKVHDLIVFKGNMFNPYGHVAIVSKVTDSEIEIVQQNVGKNSRETFDLELKNSLWQVDDSSVLGWLRLP